MEQRVDNLERAVQRHDTEIAALTKGRVDELLDYNLLTGEFMWKKDRGRMAKAGDVAGTPLTTAYISIKIDGKPYQAHRLAWLLFFGEFPKNQIDHINGIRDDNRWVNLRSATRSQNMCNRGKLSSNTSGYTGVTWHPKTQKWRAVINHNKKTYSLGLFVTKEEASQAYREAAKKYHKNYRAENR